MNSKTIIQAVETELKTITGIKQVYIGSRTKDIKVVTPSITISPDANPTTEEKKDSRENELTLTLYGVVYVRDVDKMVIGDSKVKGIIDIEGDIKSKLYAKFPSLGGVCNSFVLSTIAYVDNTFPVGTVVIEGRFRYTEG